MWPNEPEPGGVASNSTVAPPATTIVPVAELARLRKIEADAKAAGQITADGRLITVGMNCYVDMGDIIGCGVLSIDFDDENGPGAPPVVNLRTEDGDEFAIGVERVYSTREAAEAARKEPA